MICLSARSPLSIASAWYFASASNTTCISSRNIVEVDGSRECVLKLEIWRWIVPEKKPLIKLKTKKKRKKKTIFLFLSAQNECNETGKKYRYYKITGNAICPVLRTGVCIDVVCGNLQPALLTLGRAQLLSSITRGARTFPRPPSWTVFTRPRV